MFAEKCQCVKHVSTKFEYVKFLQEFSKGVKSGKVAFFIGLRKY